jgi:polar amino acid transport system substrate-binding protein
MKPAALLLCAAFFPTAAAQARTLADVLSTRTLSFCVQEESEPFANRRTGQGIFIDIGNRIAQQLGVALVLDWIVSADYVRKTDCDALPAAADIPSDDPLKLTSPWLQVSFVIVSQPPHEPIRSLSDALPGEIAVLASSYARQSLSDRGLEPRVAFLRNEDILQAVIAHDPPAGIVPLYSYQWFRHEHPQSTLRTDPADHLVPGLAYAASIAVRHADEPLRQKLDEIMRGLVDRGDVSSIFKKYGLTWQRPSS